MAHKILGVDVGSSGVKLARFEAGFRKAELLDGRVLALDEVAPAIVEGAAGAEGHSPTVSAGERLAGALKALKRRLSEEKLGADEIVLALPGELCSFRVVDLPFSDERRIESVLGYELESQMMSPVDELVIDHLVVGQREMETRVLAATAPRAVVRALVDAAAGVDLPLRIVAPAPLAYVALLDAEARALPGASMIVDIGAACASVCVVRAGVPEFARTIARGGKRLSDAIGTSFRLDEDAAERAKIEVGFVGHAGLAPQSPSQSRMDACLREALAPLVRELRQTMAAYRASYGEAVERLWLTGGGARLVGLREHLGEELTLPAAALPIDESMRSEDGERLAVALAMAQLGLGAAPRVNFRKGELAYRSDFSFVRAKAGFLAVAAFAVVLCAILNAAAAVRGLRREHEQLAARLVKETTELFGEPRSDARAISEELKGVGKGGPPIPTVTAFDVFDDISRRVPANDKIKLDVNELDIKPKKVFIKGTAETAQQVDDLAAALGKIECFEEVQQGKLSSMTVNVPKKEGSTSSTSDSKDKDKDADTREIKQFTLTINTTCQ